MKKMRLWLLAVFSVLISLTLPGCLYVPIGLSSIGEIVKAPSNYEGCEVKVIGIATPGLKVPLIENRSYYLKDATGEIVVWTTGPMPVAGQEIIVRGNIDLALIIGGQSFGLSMKEIERHPTLQLPWK